jgi:hypothetical protein
MNSNDGLDALRRANPRAQAGFAEAVGAARGVRAGLIEHAVREYGATRGPALPRRRLIAVSAAGVGVAAAGGMAAVLLGAVGTVPGTGAKTGGGGAAVVHDPAAALRLAAAVTSGAAQDSGVAVVRVTQNGQPWAGKTVTWHGDDIAIVEDTRSRNSNNQTRIVDGVLYALGAWPGQDDGWVDLGSPANIDPDSGTTPLEILAAVRADSAGQTLARITGSMTGLTTTTGPDGSVTYAGQAPAGVVAQEQGFKEGQTIRVLPYGYVAHDAAANPASPVAVTIVAGSDHVVRSITAQWGGGSAWTYTVTFSELGTAPAIVAPANAKPLTAFRTSKPATR